METRQTLNNARSQQPTITQLAGGMIISVGEARKILGTDAKDLSDDELIAEIYAMSEIAQALLKLPVSSKEKLL